MTAEEAVKYIENYGWSTQRLGLDRTKELLEKLGNPQKKLKFIHVAGSNGKGSACAMFDAILRSAGYKCGLYTSPYIQDFCERIQLAGKNIDGQDLADITERVKSIAEAMEDHPSQFELVTAVALEYYCEKKADIVVLEVGLGGRLDSTNAIDAPELACITNIGLEHTEYLGDTIAKISGEKAGIIKAGCNCVCYDGDSDATIVVTEVCKEKNVPLACVDFSNLKLNSYSLDGQSFAWKGSDYNLNLIGPHQLHNAALVLTGVEMLRDRGWNISDEAVREGLATVKWPARLEILNKNPLFILDGGHNPQCAKALADSVRELLPGRKAVFLTGVLADKDYDSIFNIVMPCASEFVCLTPLSDRALPSDELVEYLQAKGAKAFAAESYEEGIIEALKRAGNDGAVIAFGSLYMAGEIRTIFKSSLRKFLRKKCIAARNALPADERTILSNMAVQNLVSTEEFKAAKTILIYKATKAEISVEALENAPELMNKTLSYPLCTSKNEMTALIPNGPESWKNGYCGITEPIRESSKELAPEDIDLIVCPCSGFDEDCNRMGMGGGFYDRYLTMTKKAKICAIAFEAQKIDSVPVCEWDRAMDFVVTDTRVYRKK